MRIATWIQCFLFFLMSCGEETPFVEPRLLPSDFYPVDVNAYSVYEVLEIRFDLEGPDTSRYQLRVEISDSIVSADQTKTYFLGRSKRDSEEELWQIDSTWTFRFQEENLVSTENNIPFLKLTNPIEIGSEWDGNIYNSLTERTFYYQEIGRNDSSTVKLIIEDIERNLVSQDERFEIYQKGVGLIEKNYIILNLQNGEIESGLILQQNLIERGKK